MSGMNSIALSLVLAGVYIVVMSIRSEWKLPRKSENDTDRLSKNIMIVGCTIRRTIGIALAAIGVGVWFAS